MRKILLLCLLFATVTASAQPKKYSVSNAHSHNDYEQKNPFWQAYNAGFGSIEADIFLIPGKELLVAHTLAELAIKPRRLDSLYLLPLVYLIGKNKGSVYPDKSKTLQLMIDIKTGALPTLDKFIETIKRYPVLVNTKTLRITISGGRPAPAAFTSYPSFINFDGELKGTYDKDAMSRIKMLSANLKDYTNWNGKDALSPADREKVKAEIDKAHRLGKPIRFWEAPDQAEAWSVLKELGVDYLNTDKIEELASFLGK